MTQPATENGDGEAALLQENLSFILLAFLLAPELKLGSTEVQAELIFLAWVSISIFSFRLNNFYIFLPVKALWVHFKGLIIILSKINIHTMVLSM